MLTMTDTGITMCTMHIQQNMKKNVESITYVNKQSGALMCYMDIDIKKIIVIT